MQSENPASPLTSSAPTNAKTAQPSTRTKPGRTVKPAFNDGDTRWDCSPQNRCKASPTSRPSVQRQLAQCQLARDRSLVRKRVGPQRRNKARRPREHPSQPLPSAGLFSHKREKTIPNRHTLDLAPCNPLSRLVAIQVTTQLPGSRHRRHQIWGLREPTHQTY